MKKGFTLAEVLITLGIIGVVAALTIPSLIQIHKKNVTTTRLKQTYSLLYQALKSSEIDNNEMSTWNFGEVGCEGASEFTEKYVVPYIKVAKTCICDNTGECDFKVGSINNPTNTSNTDYYTTRSEKLFLSNGSLIAISRAPATDFPIIVIDIKLKRNQIY